jgi:cytochrome oxidase assembly protein ShyY1
VSPVVLDFGDRRVLVDSGWGPGTEVENTDRDARHPK